MSTNLKARYNSKYSLGKKITAIQYAGEIMCERLANYRKTNLPLKFWKMEEWKQYFITQTMIASSLIKKHGERALIKGTLDPKANKIFSLRNQQIKKIIENYGEENS